MSEPSQDAMRLALSICSEWASCPRQPLVEHLAARIDRELQLPQRNAALLLAQTLVDELYRNVNGWETTVRLHDALAAIKSK